MVTFIKLSGLALVCAVLALLLKKYDGACAVALGAAGCCVAGILLLELCEPILAFLRELAAAASIDGELLNPLLKTVGIGLLTQYSSSACADAGESALAGMTESGGALMCLCLALPLLTRLLGLIRTLMGG